MHPVIPIPADGISLRPATMADAEMLFSWRNDPTTRRASHDSTPVVFEQHVAWLTATLMNPQRKLFVAVAGPKPVGTVGARRDEDGVWELSWTVAPSCRGKGYGIAMVRSLVSTLEGPLRAEVKAGNTGSMRIAEAAGLFCARVDGNILHYVAPAGRRRA